MSANSTAERVKLRAVHGGDAVAAATINAVEAAFSAAYDNYNAVGSTAANAVANAAKLNPDATWAAVNEMLQAL